MMEAELVSARCEAVSSRLPACARQRRNEAIKIFTHDQRALAKLAHRQAAVLDDAVKGGSTDAEQASGLGYRQC